MGRATYRPRGNPLAWLVAACALALVALACYDVTRPGSAGAQHPAPPQVNAVYLVDPANSVLDRDLARDWGVRVVEGVPELLAAAEGAEVIAIEGASFNLVDPQWLAAQYRQDRILFTVNVPPSRLMRLTGNNFYDDAFYERFPGRPFFACAYQRQQDGRVTHGGSGSDFIYTPEDLLKRLYFQTEAGQAASRRAAPPVPTHPMPLRAATRPRPTPTPSPPATPNAPDGAGRGI
jgi:hypothetical protein